MRFSLRPMPLLVKPSPVSPATARIIVRPKLRITTRPLRVLDFDIENRPLTYLGSDFTTAEVTAIAWGWAHDPGNIVVRLLGEDDLIDILQDFLADYALADVVTGHYIRGHDLPMINGALVELGMPVLEPKMTSDTKLDFARTKGISLSQESLGAMLRLEQQKESMNQSKWRAANRLTPEGLAEVRRRVVGDVKQHMALRQELVNLGYLASPKLWRSGSARVEAYVP